MIWVAYYIWHNNYILEQYLYIKYIYRPIKSKIYLGFSFVLVRIILVAVVFLLGVLFSKKINFYEEKISPFECGFTPKLRARLPFSVRFFLLCLVFLIFDVELILIFPFTLNVLKMRRFLSRGLLASFLFILFVGTLHEWNQGILDWSI